MLRIDRVRGVDARARVAAARSGTRPRRPARGPSSTGPEDGADAAVPVLGVAVVAVVQRHHGARGPRRRGEEDGVDQTALQREEHRSAQPPSSSSSTHRATIALQPASATTVGRDAPRRPRTSCPAPSCVVSSGPPLRVEVAVAVGVLVALADGRRCGTGAGRASAAAPRRRRLEGLREARGRRDAEARDPGAVAEEVPHDHALVQGAALLQLRDDGAHPGRRSPWSAPPTRSKWRA